MKENEASVIIGNIPVNGKDGCYSITEYQEAKTVAVQALEEIQQYRTIGTPEECWAAVEKQTAKKVISFEYHNGTINYGCPVCKWKIISKIFDMSKALKPCPLCGCYDRGVGVGKRRTK